MALPEVEVTKTLDARGLSCPMPMLRTKKALKDMKSGEVLEVLGTDPGSKNDIPDFCEKHGYEFLGFEDDPGGFTRYLIRVK